ncbi:MAG: hypothetical protein AAGG48_03060 [Planctomycetota bacterium]
MRQEQIIANVARVVTTAIREMEAVVLFVRSTALHLLLRRMPLGTPGHQMSMSVLPIGGQPMSGQPGRTYSGDAGSKRGSWLNPISDGPSCPVGSDLG